MNYIKVLQEKRIFTLKDVLLMLGNVNSAKSLLQNYKKRGYISSVRKNLYVALDLVNEIAMADKYEIATATSETSFISYHSAMEFYGFVNQAFNNVTFSSKQKIQSFNYEGIEYKSIKSPISDGVVTSMYNDNIRISNIERTVIDCINDINLAGGLEELLKCLDMITQLDESLLIQYLRKYNKKILWQKSGYILELFKNELNLTQSFFDICRENIGERKNYLIKEKGIIYNNSWRLYVPNNIDAILNRGGKQLV